LLLTVPENGVSLLLAGWSSSPWLPALDKMMTQTAI
jgi:hypothetical protein